MNVLLIGFAYSVGVTLMCWGFFRGSKTFPYNGKKYTDRNYTPIHKTDKICEFCGAPILDIFNGKRHCCPGK